MAGDNFTFSGSHTLHGNRVLTGGVVAIDSRDLKIFHTYNLSWNPIGREMRVTKSEGGRIYEIDG